ncbi:uncharacterized protein LOC135398592 [Ornithodoros turicata]|uniref:uncharacterized protein LOC135398592 n=1 Tax=Ornithodoros turicata TaxID=34597 RepID=UPI00313A199B
MSGLPDALPAVSPPLQCSIYADDICIWASEKNQHSLRKSIQAGINAAADFVQDLRLTMSPEKFKLMLIGRGASWKHSRPVSLNGSPLEVVRSHTFLGITLDSRLSWAPFIRECKKRSLTSSNLVRHLSSFSSGCPPRTLAAIHNATTVAKLLYALPFASPSKSSFEHLEQLNRKGLRQALGLPPSSSSEALYAETASLPLRLRVTQLLLNQLVRLNLTSAGRALVLKLEQRPSSRLHCTLRTLQGLNSSLPKLPSLHPPWAIRDINISTRIPGLSSKRRTPDIVAKSLATERIISCHKEATQVYTDASLDPDSGISAIAFHIPCRNLSEARPIIGAHSSTEAELLAIYIALQAIEDSDIRRAVILSDSRGALSRISNRYDRCIIADRVHRKLQSLLLSNKRICLQWIPSHRGIPGNEEADRLSKEATKLTPEHKAPATISQIKKSIYLHLWNFHPEKHTAEGTAPPLCITSGLSRREASLLLRIRSSCGRTKAHLYQQGNAPDPFCPTCRVPETIPHLIDRCHATSAARAQLHQRLQAAGIRDRSPVNILYPTGPVRSRKILQSELLKFLRLTQLDQRL